jgi:hypothetical protein
VVLALTVAGCSGSPPPVNDPGRGVTNAQPDSACEAAKDLVYTCFDQGRSAVDCRQAAAAALEGAWSADAPPSVQRSLATLCYEACSAADTTSWTAISEAIDCRALSR